MTGIKIRIGTSAAGIVRSAARIGRRSMRKGCLILAQCDEEPARPLLDELEMLVKAGLLDRWHKAVLGPGIDTLQVQQQIDDAQIVLLLVSDELPRLLAGCEPQLGQAIHRGSRGEALVIAVMLRPTGSWQYTRYNKLKSLPCEGTVGAGADVHTVQRVVETVQRVVEEVSLLLNDLSAASTDEQPPG